MEGKAVLFKRFADIDSIDLDVSSEDPEEIINCVKLLGAGWGGINLEDIKAPECFIIEQRLRELMDIPVFHDDQHGTAIIAAAGLLNSLDLTGRKIEDTKIVCNGAGAAGIACLELLEAIGFKHENLILCDTKGVIYQGRTDGMNQWKSAHAVKTSARTLADAHEGRRRVLRPLGQGRGDQGHGRVDGAEADHLRHGQSRSGDHRRGGRRGARRRHHGDRPLGLSEPGQQRAGLSLHLPRRARRARHHHQHGDEDRGRPRARRTRARGRARRGRRGLRRAAEVRAGLHHPGAVRSAADFARAAGGRARPRWIPAWRASRSRTWMPTASRCASRRDPIAGVLQQVFQRLRRSPKRVVFAEGEEEQVIRAAATFVQQGLGTALLVGREEPIRQSAKNLGIELGKGIEIINARAVEAQRQLCRLSLRAAAAPGLSGPRRAAADQPGPQSFRRLHGGARRRRRHGDGRHAELLGRAGGRAPRASIPSPAIASSACRWCCRADAPCWSPTPRSPKCRMPKELAEIADRGGRRRAPHGLRAARRDAGVLDLRPSAGRALGARASRR